MTFEALLKYENNVSIRGKLVLPNTANKRTKAPKTKLIWLARPLQ